MSASPSPTPQPLPRGFQLEGYRIDHQLSKGGFGIVYLAYDSHEAPLAIKEYLPSSLARRGEGEIEPSVPAEHLTAFNHGLKCFFEEGRALARLDHPYLVRVTDFFRANATVYLVMRYERGRTLQDYVRQRDGPVTEDYLRDLFARLLDGLDEVHANNLLHLDIKPANIYLRADSSPVLLDFGAARQALGSETSDLRGMYTPGFAAPEQYDSRRDQLGPWTDLYAVGATLYACLAGSAPPPADARRREDEMVPARKRWRGEHSAQFLSIIDYCLTLDPRARPQSARELQEPLIEKSAPVGRQGSWLDRVKGLFG